MKKKLTTLTCTILITGIMSSNALVTSINDMPDKKIIQSEKFYSNDNYNLNIDTQNTTSDFFVDWGASFLASSIDSIFSI